MLPGPGPGAAGIGAAPPVQRPILKGLLPVPVQLPNRLLLLLPLPFSAPGAAATGTRLLLPFDSSAFDLASHALNPPSLAGELLLLLLSSSSSPPKLILPSANAGRLKSFLPGIEKFNMGLGVS